ncbi:hypothetical protein CC86DRAFT_405979 [Ophiobolus disseminans]|uniref:J domain-containing protein n=1 Tax=Ophiobolus disseminans TaxID=1469910 RepID=A0A6A7A073_9PLEO|nr:hypothetical protein CC86DRAFT_405979 [Ophiobolus disseminans]
MSTTLIMEAPQQQQIIFEQPADQVVRIPAPQVYGIDYGMEQLAINLSNNRRNAAGVSENIEAERVKREADEVKKQLLVKREKLQLKAEQEELADARKQAMQAEDQQEEADRLQNREREDRQRIEQERMDKQYSARATASPLRITEIPNDRLETHFTEQDHGKGIDLYFYLGLDCTVTHTHEKLLEMYRAKIMQHHPDKQAHMSPDQRKHSDVRARQINLVRSVLIDDPERRTAYDDKHVISEMAF